MTIIMIYHVRSKYTAVGKYGDWNKMEHELRLLSMFDRPERDPVILLHLLLDLAIGNLP